jgi:putative MFS transporter
LKDFGVPGVFIGITVCMLLVVLAIGLFGPKTNGLRLEELNH